MNEYDGNDRREIGKDHDTLIQMVQILQNHVDNFNEHVKSFKTHEIRDESNFDSLKKDGLNTQKIVWMAAGAIMAVEALPTFLKLIHVLNK